MGTMTDLLIRTYAGCVDIENKYNQTRTAVIHLRSRSPLLRYDVRKKFQNKACLIIGLKGRYR